MPLTNTSLNAKPKDKPFKLSDSDGMYLLVSPNGTKAFRLDYRFAGKRKTLALGTYPQISLKEARQVRDDARRLISQGIDPMALRKEKKLKAAVSNTFEAVSKEFFAVKMTDKSESHTKRTLNLLNRDLIPYLGNKAIGEIKAPELLAALRLIEAKGTLETARKASILAGQIWRYAIATGRGDIDISQSLGGAKDVMLPDFDGSGQ